MTPFADCAGAHEHAKKTHMHEESGSSAGRVSGLRGSSHRVATLLTILKRKLVTEQEVERQIAEHSEPHLTSTQAGTHESQAKVYLAG